MINIDVNAMYPTMLNVIGRIEVKNVSENKNGKQCETVVQVESLLSATRFINSFVPKRGYKHVSWNIKEVEVLNLV